MVILSLNNMTQRSSKHQEHCE